MTSPRLTERFRIPTSGARAVEAFTLAGHSYLAIPQLALDVPGSAPTMTGGDSNTEALILRSVASGYVEQQRLTVPGGEDAEFFRIGDRAFLAFASLRRGAGPYEFAVDSPVFEWDGAAFVPFQAIRTVAAKQWRHFTIGDRVFLALAQGVAGLPDTKPSAIYEWDGTRFVLFQEIPSVWGYDWLSFTLGDRQFLAYADHAAPSVLYAWDGNRFVAHQELAEHHARAFARFDADGDAFLACALLQSESKVLRWNGTAFVTHQVLEGLGARQLVVLNSERDLFVVRINFILGTQQAPTTALASQLYCWSGGRLVEVATFPTSGGCDATVIHAPEGVLVAVSNSLSEHIRFRTDTVVYAFHD